MVVEAGKAMMVMVIILPNLYLQMMIGGWDGIHVTPIPFPDHSPSNLLPSLYLTILNSPSSNVDSSHSKLFPQTFYPSHHSNSYYPNSLHLIVGIVIQWGKGVGGGGQGVMVIVPTQIQSPSQPQTNFLFLLLPSLFP